MRERINWAKYPKLREIFEHRPIENVFWKELIALAWEVTAIRRMDAGEGR